MVKKGLKRQEKQTRVEQGVEAPSPCPHLDDGIQIALSSHPPSEHPDSCSNGETEAWND